MPRWQLSIIVSESRKVGTMIFEFLIQAVAEWATAAFVLGIVTYLISMGCGVRPVDAFGIGTAAFVSALVLLVGFQLLRIAQ